MSMDTKSSIVPYRGNGPRRTCAGSMALPTLAPSRLRRIHSMPAPPHVAGLLNYESPPKRLVPPRRRAQAIKAACEACRKRKIKVSLLDSDLPLELDRFLRQVILKCTGERPSCHPCEKQGHKCIYTTAPMQTHLQALRHQNDVFAREKSLYEDLYRLFMTLPSADAIEMLHRLRSGAGVESIVLHVGDGDAVSSF
ncbi:hypothetical protein EV126DRAFT_412540 [Verticillium dahliae]|nr:hypothetical protein EV126DRAFT_412540 [Verticillium dahliae]